MGSEGAHSGDTWTVDLDDLRGLVSDDVIRRGIAYFQENRVIGLRVIDGGVVAQVEGSVPESPYEVLLEGGADPTMGCTCPYDAEPVCKHIVAVLLAWSARQGANNAQVASAADAQVEERRQRGRTGVLVEHVSGAPAFGVWEARSVERSPYAPPAWRVQIRSLDERANHCNCPDFAVNLLGTCKHIEAVLHRLRKRGRKAGAPPAPFVGLAWDVPGAPRVRLVMSPAATPEVRALHGGLFGADGLLRGPASAIHGLLEALDGRDDVLVGDEVRELAARLGAEAARSADAARIRRDIQHSGGTLPGVRARLYPYQVEGVAFLASNGRALLADDMGLGKTLQTIAAARWLMDDAGVRTVLVVCPTSLKRQWAREIARFTDQDALVIEGGAAARRVLYRQRPAFAITNYEVVLRDHSVIQEDLRPDLLVLDEAQRIRNWRTKAAAAIKALRTRYAFVLTGTPLENRLEDLYSLMQVVDPRVLGPLWRFLVDFHVTTPNGRVIGYRNLGELRRRLAPVMLRRDRSLVRDQLPDRTELRLDLPLSARQQELHAGALMNAGSLAAILHRRPLTPSEEHKLMAALQQARMACNAAGLVDGVTVGSPKLDELGRLLEELCVGDGRKVIVFSQWERMTAMAEDVARSLKLGVVRLHGGVPSTKRGELVERFQTDPAVQVFLSTDAGGVGLNLQAATVVINLEVPWNPAILAQRIGRAHRLGQREPVHVITLLAADSYEQRVAELGGGKRALFEGVVDEEAGVDVVGLTKRSLDLAVELLEDTGVEAQARPSPEAPSGVSADQESLDSAREEEVPEPVRGEPDVAAALVAVQEALAGRIERVLGMRGGLLVVVDTMDDAARAVGDTVLGVPVAVIDSRAAAALGRLGAGPLAGAEPVWERPPQVASAPMLDLARRKLRAAELLCTDAPADALESLGASMLAVVCHRASADPPPPERVALWLYADAMPRGHASDEEAASILRAWALARSPDVPRPLLDTAMADARRMVGGA
ncbi:MAG: hypothetical protein AMXMBFR64_08840 [Myxococcales bacterium]